MFLARVRDYEGSERAGERGIERVRVLGGGGHHARLLPPPGTTDLQHRPQQVLARTKHSNKKASKG